MFRNTQETGHFNNSHHPEFQTWIIRQTESLCTGVP